MKQKRGEEQKLVLFHTRNLVIVLNDGSTTAPVHAASASTVSVTCSSAVTPRVSYSSSQPDVGEREKRC